MDSLQISARTRLYFEPVDRDLAPILAGTCVRSRSIIRDIWGLKEPEECRVYIMTSALRFLFHAATWRARLFYALTLPLWYFRVRRLWRFCGGWTQMYRHRPAVGVKPPRLILQADRSIGKLVFEDEPDPIKKMEQLACHELTHASAAHLRLPLWLNEGLAMLSMDKYLGRQTVKDSTLNVLAQSPPAYGEARYRHLSAMSKEEIAYHYARGYWATRLLAECHPELLREILGERLSRRQLTKRIAMALGCNPHLLWRTFDAAVAARYGTCRTRPRSEELPCP